MPAYESIFPFVVLGGFLALMVVLAAAVQRQRRRRAAAFAQVASFLGLHHYPGSVTGASWWGGRGSGPGAEIPLRFGEYAPFRTGRGGNRRAENLMEGKYRGHEVLWCEYKFVVSTGKSSQTITFGVALARLASAWPELTIEPETLDRKIQEMFGGEDIDFESEEFSRRFWVKSEDRKFAYDVLHPRSMELIMRPGWQRWHILGEWVCLWNRASMGDGAGPDDVQPSLDAVVAFIELAPNFRRPTIHKTAVPDGPPVFVPKRQG